MRLGEQFEVQTFTVCRDDLKRYASASGDSNPIHASDFAAASVGLPGVIAHGMFTMALAARAVDHWTGGAEVVELTCKFTNPVFVPNDETGTMINFVGHVQEIGGGLATITLEVTCNGQKVLGMPKAVVRA